MDNLVVGPTQCDAQHPTMVLVYCWRRTPKHAPIISYAMLNKVHPAITPVYVKTIASLILMEFTLRMLISVKFSFSLNRVSITIIFKYPLSMNPTRSEHNFSYLLRPFIFDLFRIHVSRRFVIFAVRLQSACFRTCHFLTIDSLHPRFEQKRLISLSIDIRDRHHIDVRLFSSSPKRCLRSSTNPLREWPFDLASVFDCRLIDCFVRSVFHFSRLDLHTSTTLSEIRAVYSVPARK